MNELQAAFNIDRGPGPVILIQGQAELYCEELGLRHVLQWVGIEGPVHITISLAVCKDSCEIPYNM